MYGLIGKMTVAPGTRDEVIELLLGGTQAMPGCISYVVAKAQTEEDAIWITEVWQDKESHDNSLKLESVQKVIAKARPMISGMGPHIETIPVGDFTSAPEPLVPERT